MLLDKGGIHVKRTSQQAGVILHDYERILLQHLHVHRTMRASSVHKLYTMLSKKKLSKVNISHRLSKLLNSGVLSRMEEQISDVEGRFIRYSYKLGDRGFDVLVSMGYLTISEANKQVAAYRNLKLPSYHTKASSIICNHIAIECMKDDSASVMKMSRGNTHSEFGTTSDVTTEMKGIVIPDYVFENNNCYVTIEIDTGRQRSHIIKSKYERYKKKAASLKESGKSIMCVFVVVDDSVSNEQLGDRAKRVNSLKNMFPPFNDWGDNLHFYAIRAIHAPQLIVKLLTGKEPIPKLSREFLCDDWIDSVKVVENNRITVSRYNPSQFVYSNSAEHMNADGFVQFTEKGKYPKSYALIFMQEGSVSSYQTYQTNLLRAEQYNDSIQEVDNIASYKIMLIYDKSLNATNDIIALNIPEVVSVLITDISSWQQRQFNLSDTSIEPKIIELVTPFKKVTKEGYHL